jgi:phage gp45-like
MQRTSPFAAALRAYTGGGARALIDTIDDNKLMQQSNKCQGMRGESWGKMEAPQNYGFTSVVGDATKTGNGMIKNCAEGFLSFLGGNRSFPIMGMMDDRRHRLMNLAKDAAKGASAMFGLKEWGQQFLNTEDGNFLTGNVQKKNRFALVENKNGQKQQGQTQGGSSGNGASAAARTRKLINPPGSIELPDGRVVIRSKSGVEFEVELFDEEAHWANVGTHANGGGSGGNGSGGDGSGGAGDGAGGGKSTGQKTLHKEDSTIWMEQNKTDTQNVHGEAVNVQRTGSDSTLWYTENNSCQSTDGHSHIRGAGIHIWVAGGCFSDMPIVVKKDGLCKSKSGQSAPKPKDDGNGSA